jgi:hypothetical protein
VGSGDPEGQRLRSEVDDRDDAAGGTGGGRDGRTADDPFPEPCGRPPLDVPLALFRLLRPRGGFGERARDGGQGETEKPSPGESFHDRLDLGTARAVTASRSRSPRPDGDAGART